VTLGESLREVTAVLVPSPALPVHETVAVELEHLIGRPCRRLSDHGRAPGPGELRLGVVEDDGSGSEWYSLAFRARGSGELLASRPHLLFSGLHWLWERHADDPAPEPGAGAQVVRLDSCRGRG